MAAALIPLIMGLAPDVINLVTSLVHSSATKAETTFGPGTGPVKAAQVFSDVITALTSAATIGTISKILPPDDTIRLIIQSTVQSMQLSGLIGGTSSVPAVSANPASIKLSAGQSITISD
jgi:hypothetical protein